MATDSKLTKVTSVQVPSHNKTAKAAKTVINPFDSAIVKADLLHSLPVTSHEQPMKFLGTEWAQSQRMLIVKRRWYHISVKDWQREMDLLCEALLSDSASKKFTVYEPFREVLEEYRDRSADGNTKTVILKRAILAKCAEIVSERSNELYESMMQLAYANGLAITPNAWKTAKEEIIHDCEKRGSLTLGQIDQFSTEFCEEHFSARWSWCDSF